MIDSISKILAALLITLSAFAVNADEDLPISGILNPEFASHLATITTINAEDEEGVFVTSADAELVISMQRSEIVEISNESLGGFLMVYEETGQSLFELPEGGYQMQLTTSNGPINFSYLNHDSSIETESRLAMTEDILLQESDDGFYQLYLLTTGELRVSMGPDEDGTVFELTFTGIPALNIKEEQLTH